MDQFPCTLNKLESSDSATLMEKTDADLKTTYKLMNWQYYLGKENIARVIKRHRIIYASIEHAIVNETYLFSSRFHDKASVYDCGIPGSSSKMYRRVTTKIRDVSTFEVMPHRFQTRFSPGVNYNYNNTATIAFKAIPL